MLGTANDDVFSLLFLLPAERALNEAQKHPGHPLQVLQIIANATPSEGAMRQAAAVHFKNVVKKGWDTNQEVSVFRGRNRLSCGILKELP